MALFSRKQQDTTTATAGAVGSTVTTSAGPGGKGRPTPTRKQAEAANKAKAKVPRTRKEMLAAQRDARSSSSQQVRAGMKAGDERYLLARDRGPVRRYIRDFVDSRFSFVEMMIPILIVTMALGWTGGRGLAAYANALLLGSLLAVIVDLLVMRHKLRVQLAVRFPEAPVKGTTYYAITRAMQMKFMRIPKAQVKVGDKLPDRYR